MLWSKDDKGRHCELTILLTNEHEYTKTNIISLDTNEMRKASRERERNEKSIKYRIDVL